MKKILISTSALLAGALLTAGVANAGTHVQTKSFKVINQSPQAIVVKRMSKTNGLKTTLKGKNVILRGTKVTFITKTKLKYIPIRPGLTFTVFKVKKMHGKRVFRSLCKIDVTPVKHKLILTKILGSRYCTVHGRTVKIK